MPVRDAQHSNVASNTPKEISRLQRSMLGSLFPGAVPQVIAFRALGASVNDRQREIEINPRHIVHRNQRRSF